MEKHAILVASAMIFCVPMAPVNGQYYSETVMPPSSVEKMTRLHFFFHDIVSGKIPHYSKSGFSRHLSRRF
ncbi:hypothetical protein GQ457_18G013020 [Hibiscus cannabinus]